MPRYKHFILAITILSAVVLAVAVIVLQRLNIPAADKAAYFMSLGAGTGWASFLMAVMLRKEP